MCVRRAIKILGAAILIKIVREGVALMWTISHALMTAPFCQHGMIFFLMVCNVVRIPDEVLRLEMFCSQFGL